MHRRRILLCSAAFDSINWVGELASDYMLSQNTTTHSLSFSFVHSLSIYIFHFPSNNILGNFVFSHSVARSPHKISEME